MHTHDLSPANALRYVLGGKGMITLTGAQSRYTYKFNKSQDDKVIFVGLLTGASNTADYTYIGFIGTDKAIRAGRKGNPNHPAYKALHWYLTAAQHKPQVAEKARAQHEGTCGRCGRALTVPESIESGIGPICANK